MGRDRSRPKIVFGALPPRIWDAQRIWFDDQAFATIGALKLVRPLSGRLRRSLDCTQQFPIFNREVVASPLDRHAGKTPGPEAQGYQIPCRQEPKFAKQLPVSKQFAANDQRDRDSGGDSDTQECQALQACARGDHIQQRPCQAVGKNHAKIARRASIAHGAGPAQLVGREIHRKRVRRHGSLDDLSTQNNLKSLCRDLRSKMIVVCDVIGQRQSIRLPRQAPRVRRPTSSPIQSEFRPPACRAVSTLGAKSVAIPKRLHSRRNRAIGFAAIERGNHPDLRSQARPATKTRHDSAQIPGRDQYVAVTDQNVVESGMRQAPAPGC